jgi:hypothetical protein
MSYKNNQIGYTATAPNNGLIIRGQVGLGTSSPAASALLSMSSTTQGFLPPSMTSTQKSAISSPATGLVVYDNSMNLLQFYNGADWVAAAGNVSSVSNSDGTLTISPTTGAVVASISSTYAGQTSITTLGTIATGTWHGSIIPLAYGGTNAGLTASAGGIFYSTASAGAILAGTATANQVLLSGSSAAPLWSTATYPVTTAINQILYSSSANVIGGITVSNNGVLISGTGGIPSWLSAGTTGQVLIATTSNPPSWGTLSGLAVTSITGTANQIVASASTGAVTLSFPAAGGVSIGTTTTGLVVQPVFTPASGTLYGAQILPNFEPPTGDTYTATYGINIAPTITPAGTGTVTTAYGAYVAGPSVVTNTVATAYGLYVASPSGPGTITRQTAFYSDNASIGYSGSNLPTTFPTNGLIVSGNVGIGASAPTAFLQVSNATIQGVGYTKTGVNFNLSTYSSVSSDLIYGFYNQPTIIAGSTSQTGYGFLNLPTFTATTGTSYANVIGAQFNCTCSGSGTISNAYSIYVGASVGASNNYAAYFGGLVGIGTTSPGTLLDISGGFFRTTYNTSSLPPANITNGGLAVAWNYSAGGAEVNLYNVYPSAATSFRFSQLTSSSTIDVLQIKGNGGVGMGAYANPGLYTPPANGLIVSGNVGIGTSSPISAAQLNVNSASSYNILVNGTQISTDSGTSGGGTMGINISATLNPSTGAGNAFGLYSSCTFAAPTSKTISTVAGMLISNNYGGNAGTITNTYGLYIAQGGSGSGTITTAYGLYCNTPTAGSTNYCAYFQGNVGIGTASPGQALEISGTNAVLYMNSGTSNTILFNGVGAGAPTTGTRSVGTKIVFYPQVGTGNADYAMGISGSVLWTGVPNSTATYYWYAGSQSIMTLTGTGILSVNTTSNSGTLNVGGAVYAGAGESHFWNSSYTDPYPSNTFAVKVSGQSGASGLAIIGGIYNNGGQISTSASTWAYLSDMRIKEDVQPTEEALPIIDALMPVKFRYTKEWLDHTNHGIEDKVYYSLIADEVEKVMPSCVFFRKHGDFGELKHLDIHNINILLIKAVQELSEKIKQLEGKLCQHQPS